MSKERNLGKKVTQAGLRVGAALLATQMSFGMDRVAHADINKPVRYPLADGRLLADAPLRTAGRAVDFTGPHGLEFCGTSTTEPTILTVVGQEDTMNIKVIGNPDVFVDPEDLGGSDYPSRAASAVEALQSKATELINRTNRLWRRIAVILTRDAVNQNVCDLITDSGAFAQPAPEVAVFTCEAKGNRTQPQMRTELIVAGYPGPWSDADVLAAYMRTACGPRASSTVRAAEAVGDCNPLQITTLTARQDAVIDGKPVALPVRDKNFGCERPLWLKETGVAKGENFKLDLPGGWSVVISPTTVAVHREGGVQRDFLNGDVVVVNGPFRGGVGVYEGWIGALPTEWSAKVANERLVIQRIQNRRPNSQIKTFVG